jgi:chromosome segregation ATPase
VGDRAGPGRPRAARAPRRARGRQARSRGGSASVIVNTALVLLAVAVAGAGWFIVTQQERLEQNKAELADAAGRLQALEERLRMTDDLLSESDADTNEQLTYWESEIRKLWDVSNKRNRGWIETNQANIRQLTTSMGNAQRDVKSLQGSMAQLDASVKRNQDLADRLTAMDMQMRRIVSQQRDLVDKANSASQAASSLKATLERRVRENEEAIAAIDAHRARLNSQIAELQRSTGSRSPTPAGP